MTAPAPELDPFALQEATWPPAEAADLGPWRAGFTVGAGRRVASARPRAPDQTLDWPALAAELPQVEAYYADRGAAPVLQLPGERPDHAADADLLGRGYALEAPSLLLSIDAEPLAARQVATPGGPYLIPLDAPLAALNEIWAAGGIGPERRAVMARATGPSQVIVTRLDHRVCAGIFVAMGAGAAAVHALQVAEPYRRRGVARDLMIAAARWARANAAPRLVFSVEADNAAARALYAALGAEPIGGYRYYRRPTI